MAANELTSEDKATCGICRRQVSRYTCPACNICYCSLVCFRSEAHAQCSEGFYKRELESEIQTQPSASHEERRRMMELLKKFEEEDGKTELDDLLGGEDGDGDEDDADDLAERLAGVDIDELTAEELWDMLTPEQRESFISISKNENSSVAQDLLRKAALESDVTLPWWEASEGGLDEDHEVTGSFRNEAIIKYGKRPSIAPLPDALLRRPPGPQTGPPLLYNICVVFVAYAYTTRHLGISSLSLCRNVDDLTAARQQMRELAPFIVDKHARTLFGSMDEVVADMWPRLVDTDRASRTAFVVLLRDAARLLSPRRVAEISDVSQSPETGSSEDDLSRPDLSTHPIRDALCVLSDLINVFLRRGAADAVPMESPATAKLRFYMAHLIALPPAIMAGFSAEVGARSRQIEEEGRTEVDASDPGPGSLRPRPSEDMRAEKATPKIEEL